MGGGEQKSMAISTWAQSGGKEGSYPSDETPKKGNFLGIEGLFIRNM